MLLPKKEANLYCQGICLGKTKMQPMRSLLNRNHFNIIFILIISCFSITFINCKHDNNEKNDKKERLINILTKIKREEKDPIKKKSIAFLISTFSTENFYYSGSTIQKYDTILHLYKELRYQNVFAGDPPIIDSCWKHLRKLYGKIDTSQLLKNYDYNTLSADFLINNIHQAQNTWNLAPSFVSQNFNDFCEYILPYRSGTEFVENYRDTYYNRYKKLVDSAKSPESLIKLFYNKIAREENYNLSKTLWDYPLDYSISQMELGRRGACRHMTAFTANVMRACGLPVAVDRAIWANRSMGHSWNVLLLKNNEMYPFDALDRKKLEFTYKPAKIFRKTFSSPNTELVKKWEKEVPISIIKPNEIDVTDLYCKTYDIKVPATINQEYLNSKKTGIICVFNNVNWRIVYLGDIKGMTMTFNKMAANVAYITGVYEDGELIPTSDPFLLTENGEIVYCRPSNQTTDMKLERKYPRFKHVEIKARGMKDAVFEVSNDRFKTTKKILSIDSILYSPTIALVNTDKPYRYIRFLPAKDKTGNLAEFEIYGIKNNKEVKLIGKPMGQIDGEKKATSLINPFDKDFLTGFEKPKGVYGWVGIDLGEHFKNVKISRIIFSPMSDGNFIIPGDKYELFYWNTEWKSFETQVATDFTVNFKNVPQNTIYLLHNKTRGKEERIFTYHDGKQIWW